MGVAMSAVGYPWWDVCSSDPAGRREGPASGSVGSVALRDEAKGFEGAAVLLGSP